MTWVVIGRAADGASHLSAEEAAEWLGEFAADHQERGAEAFLERIDEKALRDRAMAVSGLRREERRHETLARQSVALIRAEFSGMRDLRLGRRTDEGDHWSVMAYFSDPAGMFVVRLLRIERVDVATTRITDWADMPCDVMKSDMIAALVFVQTFTPPDTAPERLRGELMFYHQNPRSYVRAALAAGRQDTRALFRELAALPAEARFGVLAREWRTILLVLYLPDQFADEHRLMVGRPEEDALRGLLLFRSGVRANRPELALDGLAQLSGQLGDDVNILNQTSAMLVLAGRMEEAVRTAKETAELYPTDYSTHIQWLAALRLAGLEDGYATARTNLTTLMGEEVAKVIVEHAEDYTSELKTKRVDVLVSRAERAKRELSIQQGLPTFDSRPIRLGIDPSAPVLLSP